MARRSPNCRESRNIGSEGMDSSRAPSQVGGKTVEDLGQPKAGVHRSLVVAVESIGKKAEAHRLQQRGAGCCLPSP